MSAVVMVVAGTVFWLTYKEAILDFEQAVKGLSSNTILYDRAGLPFHTLYGIESRLIIPQEQICRNLKISVLASEDARFFQHRGVDAFRLISAFWTNLRSGSYKEGASTITQQLVKLTLLSPEKTLFRKFREIAISISLEMKFSKQKILEYYLNTVYLGHGNFGVEQASLTYFNKHAENLTLAQASFLAALLKKPEAYLRLAHSLTANTEYFSSMQLEEAVNRQHAILQKLKKLNWITSEEYRTAFQEQMRVRLPNQNKGFGGYFTQHVIKLLKIKHGFEIIYGEGLKIYTTLDSDLQRLLETVVDSEIASSVSAKRQVAMVSLVPQTGNVLALIGGRNYTKTQFNRATQALRQPGSAFKPFVYAEALEQGFSVNSVLKDQQLFYEWENERGEIQVYSPGNYDGKYGEERQFINENGFTYFTDQMTLSKALEQSINTIAVQLLDAVGIQNVRKRLKRLGLRLGNKTGLCLALGCSEMSLLQLSAAYGPFINGGRYAPPVFILRIENGAGRTIYERKTKDTIIQESVYSEWTAHQINQMLKGVVRRGTARSAVWNNAPESLAGKTGTSSQNRDAWFVGYVPQLITGVWLGNDDDSPMSGEQGGRTPTLLWMKTMQQAFPTLSEQNVVPEFPQVRIKTCTVSGKQATRFCPEAVYYDYPPYETELPLCNVHAAF